MLSRIVSCGILGVDAFTVGVEVDVSAGLPCFSVVGLPDAAVRESRERVRSAVANSGFDFPDGRVTVNLAPAALRKAGAFFDLPMALGLLIATGQLRSTLDGTLVVGELALGGEVRRTDGVLAAAVAARQAGLRGLIVPRENLSEACAVGGLSIWAVSTLREAAEAAVGARAPDSPVAPPESDVEATPDFGDVRGHEAVKRAMLVAAAGMHNVLMLGPPGSGKTMMAQRLPSVLPPMSEAEALEASRVHSVAGLLRGGLLRARPFRAPHHTISDVGLVGGGVSPRPGEISLAHNGVLFLDELPLFDRAALEALRQPLEEGRITVSRASYTVTLPARFMFVAAANPCPCGYYGDARRACRCSPRQIRNWRSRLSGPVMDRIDIHIEVPRVRSGVLRDAPAGVDSATMRVSVLAAHRRQEERFADSRVRFNSQLPASRVRALARPTRAALDLLASAMETLALSARAFGRVLKVARTIADIEGSEEVTDAHVAEAVQYRLLDRRAEVE